MDASFRSKLISLHWSTTLSWKLPELYSRVLPLPVRSPPAPGRAGESTPQVLDVHTGVGPQPQFNLFVRAAAFRRRARRGSGAVESVRDCAGWGGAESSNSYVEEEGWHVVVQDHVRSCPEWTTCAPMRNPFFREGRQMYQPLCDFEVAICEVGEPGPCTHPSCSTELHNLN